MKKPERRRKMQISFVLNAVPVTLEVAPGERLLDVIRNRFHLTGTKEACGQGECGACTIIFNGEAVHSCLMLAEQADGAEIVTIEGLERNGVLETIQQAFLDAGAIQCGYCTPGMIMAAKGLLLKNPHPSREEIIEAMGGNLCRCTGYVKIYDAIELAAEGGA